MRFASSRAATSVVASSSFLDRVVVELVPDVGYMASGTNPLVLIAVSTSSQ